MKFPIESIAVGSMNPVKIEAVQFVAMDRRYMHAAKIVGFAANSGVPEQPKTLEQILLGAKNRAQHAASAKKSDLGVGLESGVFKVGQLTFDVCGCVITTARDVLGYGLSSGWQVPKTVAEILWREDIDMDEAFLRAKLTTNPKLGRSIGAVGLLSMGRVTRFTGAEQAITMALIQLDREFYDSIHSRQP